MTLSSFWWMYLGSRFLFFFLSFFLFSLPVFLLFFLKTASSFIFSSSSFLSLFTVPILVIIVLHFSFCIFSLFRPPTVSFPPFCFRASLHTLLHLFSLSYFIFSSRSFFFLPSAAPCPMWLLLASRDRRLAPPWPPLSVTCYLSSRPPFLLCNWRSQYEIAILHKYLVFSSSQESWASAPWAPLLRSLLLPLKHAL